MTAGRERGWPARVTVRRACAFSLIEVIVAVSLMSVIVLGLLATFGQVQRAFRTGITQVDVMESGRAALEMMARELEQATPTGLPGGVNFFVTNSVALDQSLPGTATRRANILQDLAFTVRENQNWLGIGYAVRSPDFVGALFRYETNYSALDLVTNILRNAARAKPIRVIDGVVQFRVRVYDRSGLLIAPPFPVGTSDQILAIYGPGTAFNPELNYTFFSNAVPAYVEIELGILEKKYVERARNLPPVSQPQFLANQAAHVQVFRQRVPVRAVDKSVYP